MTAHEEEPEISLEEKIKMLQEQELPPKKIVEEILKEDMNADVSILADALKLDKLVIGRIKGRLSRLKKLREKKAGAREGDKGEPRSPYKGELDINKILDGILSGHPDIAPKVREEVLSWADLKGGLQPMEVQSILQSMRGISTTTASIVASKYSFALMKAQQEGKLALPTPMWGPGQTPGQTPPQWGFPAFPTTGFPPPLPSAGGGMPSTPQYGVQPTMPQGTPQYGAAPQYWPPQQPWQPPTQDVRTVVEKEIHALEDRLKPKEEYVEIEEPWRDDDGKLVVGRDHQPIMRRMRVPANQATRFVHQEDQELKFLTKMKTYKDLFGPGEQLTVEKIREIIKEERPTPSETPEKPAATLEEVKAASAEAAKEAAKQVIEAREKEDKDERRHQEVISAIERSGSAKTVDGYREDSFRFLGQSLHEVAQKKPIEVIIKDGGRLLFGTGPPTTAKVEPGATGGLFDRLKERGWVVER